MVVSRRDDSVPRDREKLMKVRIKTKEVYLDKYSELLAQGARVSVKNSGWHWIVEVAGHRFDYWPTKDKFMHSKHRKIYCGWKDFITAIGIVNQSN